MLIKNITFTKVNTRLAIISIALIVGLVYANSLKNSFVWDDAIVMAENGFVKSWKNFPAIFSKSYLTPFSRIKYLGINKIGSGETSYRPVVTLSYFIDYSIWKLNPFGYHLSNMLLHIFNTILLFFLAGLITKNKKTALLCSLLFALHPVNTEAVNAISFREDLLAFLFFVSSFILYIKLDNYAGVKKICLYSSSLVLFLLGLFSKEMAVTLPLILILYDYYFLPRAKPRGIFNNFRARYSGYFIILLFYLLVWGFFMPNTNPALKYPGGNFYTDFLTMSKVFLTYVQWLFFPVNIHPTLPDDYALISSSLFEPRVLFSVSLIIALFGAAFKTRKTLKVVSFAILWFFITLLPVSNILPIMNYMASRYLYIPTLGFCLLIAGLIFKLPFRRAARDTALVLLIVYSIFTFIRNSAWRNNIVFWSEMVRNYPNNALAHSSLGASFRKSGLLDKAIREYKIAIALDSNYAKDYNALGICYYEKGALDDAIAEFKKALNLDPRLAEADVNLGAVMGDKGLYKEAIVNFEEALKIDSGSIQAYDGLGVTYARMDKFAKARTVWEKVLEINPEYAGTLDNLKKLKDLGY